ncbi:MAG: hypothetical protein JNL98_04060 [Bryobacterales bacterium]|nr:hypothetical protein [Bryobacterales bacterium]
MALKGSVGKNASNELADVAYVQHMLNYHIMYNPKMRKLGVLAPAFSPMPLTIDAISVFQADIVGLPASKRGRVDRTGPTIRALEGWKDLAAFSPPVPEATVPVEVRISNEVRKAMYGEHYDYDCTFVFSGDDSGRRLAMFEMLCVADVDDSYLHPDHVRDYIDKAPAGVAPPPLKPTYAKQRLAKMGSKTSRGLMEDFNTVFNEVNRGLKIFGQHAEGVSMMKDTSAQEQTGITRAILNVQKWFQAQGTNSNSIYSVLDLKDQYNTGGWIQDKIDSFLFG